MAYREVQDRHNDIKKIERTLEELTQLFNDVSTGILRTYNAQPLTHVALADGCTGRAAR